LAYGPFQQTDSSLCSVWLMVFPLWARYIVWVLSFFMVFFICIGGVRECFRHRISSALSTSVSRVGFQINPLFLSVLGFQGCRRVSDKERRWLLIVGMWFKRTGMEELKSSLSRIQRLMLIESSTRQGKANGSISGRRVLSFPHFSFYRVALSGGGSWVLGRGLGFWMGSVGCVCRSL
jgi:hypothetical protein